MVDAVDDAREELLGGLLQHADGLVDAVAHLLMLQRFLGRRRVRQAAATATAPSTNTALMRVATQHQDEYQYSTSTSANQS